MTTKPVEDTSKCSVHLLFMHIKLSFMHIGDQLFYLMLSYQSLTHWCACSRIESANQTDQSAHQAVNQWEAATATAGSVLSVCEVSLRWSTRASQDPGLCAVIKDCFSTGETERKGPLSRRAAAFLQGGAGGPALLHYTRLEPGRGRGAGNTHTHTHTCSHAHMRKHIQTTDSKCIRI